MSVAVLGSVGAARKLLETWRECECNTVSVFFYQRDKFIYKTKLHSFPNLTRLIHDIIVIVYVAVIINTANFILILLCP
jgi:hypothetical protein